jgi:hypothetical protein
MKILLEMKRKKFSFFRRFSKKFMQALAAIDHG